MDHVITVGDLVWTTGVSLAVVGAVAVALFVWIYANR